MLKNKRPASYDVFKSPENQNKRKAPKWSWKLVWKWLKAFLYVFAFGITLTGCIQSFAISSDTTVSSTVEFFNNKDSIAPRTVTLVSKAVGDKNNNEINGITLSQDTTTQLNGNDEQQRAIIKDLTTKTEANGGTYGTFGSYTAFVRFQNSAGFHNKVNDQYLFFSSTQNTYTSIYGDYKVNANGVLKNHNNPQWTLIPIPTIAYNEGTVGDQDPKAIENSKGRVYYIKNNISPLVNNFMYSTFARDVIQATYDTLLKLDIYKDGKLINAIDDVNNNGLASSVESRKLVNNYRLGIQPILGESQFTLTDDDNKTVEYNYHAVKENNLPDFPFKAKYPLKPIISWSDAWGYGPFYGLIIFPLAKLMNAIISSATYAYGWGVFIAILVAVLLTRLFTLIVGWKSHFVQSKQVEMNARKAKIEAKYAQFKGNKEMENRKRREIAELHKKYGFNLSSTFTQIAITTPIFIAMWKTVQSVQIFKTTNWAGLEFAQTSWREVIYNHQYQYLWIIICVATTSVLAQIVPRILNRKKNKRIMNDDELMAYKKQQKTQNIITIVFAFFAIILQSGVQVYWMMGNLWMIGQSIGIYYFQRSKYFKEKLAPKFFKKNN